MLIFTQNRVIFLVDTLNARGTTEENVENATHSFTSIIISKNIM